MPAKGTAITIQYTAWDTDNNRGRTLDAANHTLRVVKDGVPAVVANGPTEVDATNLPGLYSIILLTSENDGKMMSLHGVSSTPDVSILPVHWSNESNPVQFAGEDLDSNVGSNLNIFFENGGFPTSSIVDDVGSGGGGNPETTITIDGTSGGTAILGANGQVCQATIPAGGITGGDMDITIQQVPKADPGNQYTEVSPDYVYLITAVYTSSGLPYDNADINEIQVTIPIDLNEVAVDDLENGIKTIYYAGSLAVIESGNATAVLPADILATDYVGDGDIGSCTFEIDHLSVFAGGEPQPFADIPVADNPSGAYPLGTDVALSSITPSPTIYYTTDGSDPDDTDTEYTAPIDLSSLPITIKAITYAMGYRPSPIMTESYTQAQVATPVHVPPAGEVTVGQTITISCATGGATIHYTTDGSIPDVGDPVYTVPVPITVPTTLRSFAVAAGYIDSGLRTDVYTIAQVDDPTIVPAAGEHSIGTGIEWSVVDPSDADVRYEGSASDPDDDSERLTEYSVLNNTDWTAGTGTPTWDTDKWVFSADGDIDAAARIQPWRAQFLKVTIANEGATSIQLKDSSSTVIAEVTGVTAGSTVIMGIDYDGDDILELAIVRAGASDLHITELAFYNEFGWNEKHDEDDWLESVAAFVYSGGDWTLATGLGRLGVWDETAWENGFRPDSVRITFTGPANIQVDVWDTGAVSIGGGATVTSGEVLDLDFGINDLNRTNTLRITTGSALVVTSIEFLNNSKQITQDQTFRFDAVKTGYLDSGVVERIYTVPQVANVTFDPVAGEYAPSQDITLATVTGGATIRYSVNGDDIDDIGDGSEYSAPFACGNFTVKARAFKDGYLPSDQTSAVYTNPAAAGDIEATVSFYDDTGTLIVTHNNVESGDILPVWVASGSVSGSIEDWLGRMLVTFDRPFGSITGADFEVQGSGWDTSRTIANSGWDILQAIGFGYDVGYHDYYTNKFRGTFDVGHWNPNSNPDKSTGIRFGTGGAQSNVINVKIYFQEDAKWIDHSDYWVWDQGSSIGTFGTTGEFLDITSVAASGSGIPTPIGSGSGSAYQPPWYEIKLAVDGVADWNEYKPKIVRLTWPSDDPQKYIYIEDENTPTANVLVSQWVTKDQEVYINYAAADLDIKEIWIYGHNGPGGEGTIDGVQIQFLMDEWENAILWARFGIEQTSTPGGSPQQNLHRMPFYPNERFNIQTARAAETSASGSASVSDPGDVIIYYLSEIRVDLGLLDGGGGSEPWDYYIFNIKRRLGNDTWSDILNTNWDTNPSTWDASGWWLPMADGTQFNIIEPISGEGANEKANTVVLWGHRILHPESASGSPS